VSSRRGRGWGVVAADGAGGGRGGGGRGGATGGRRHRGRDRRGIDMGVRKVREEIRLRRCLK
jgi:hypothetical protein